MGSGLQSTHTWEIYANKIYEMARFISIYRAQTCQLPQPPQQRLQTIFAKSGDFLIQYYLRPEGRKIMPVATVTAREVSTAWDTQPDNDRQKVIIIDVSPKVEWPKKPVVTQL